MREQVTKSSQLKIYLKYIIYDKKTFFLQNEYIFMKDLYFICNTNIFCIKICFSNEIYIFKNFHLYFSV